ncbi:MAG: hypothetical protein ACLTXI_00660 [Collinsella sp.]
MNDMIASQRGDDFTRCDAISVVRLRQTANQHICEYNRSTPRSSKRDTTTAFHIIEPVERSFRVLNRLDFLSTSESTSVVVTLFSGSADYRGIWHEGPAISTSTGM